VNGGFFESLVGDIAEDGMGDGGEDIACAVFVKDVGGGGEGAGGFGHVVNQQDVAALDLADHIHRLDAGGGDAVFGDDGEFGTEGVGVGAGHFHAANVGRYDGEIGGVRMAFAEIGKEHGFGVEVVHWNVEKPLDLRGVQIHREHAADACGGDQVGHEFGGDGDARLVFAILPCVSEKWHHRDDAPGTGTTCGIDHDEQLHHVVIRRRAGRLDDEDVVAADIFVDFDKTFTIRKRRDLDVGQRMLEILGDALGKSTVGGSADQFHRQAGTANMLAGRIVDRHPRRGNTLCGKHDLYPAIHPMTPADATIAQSRTARDRGGKPGISLWISIGVSLLALVWFYFFVPRYGADRMMSAVSWLMSAWNPETDYEHGWMFPFVIGGLIIYRLKEIRASIGPGEWWGLGVVLVGVVIYTVGYRTLQPRITVGALPILAWGSVIYLGGSRMGLKLAFPLFFFWLAVPLPSFQQATVHLQLIATMAAHHLSDLLGVATYYEGTEIYSRDGSWEPLSIAGGCSGIRSLMALLMISAAWAYIAKMAMWKRALLFLSAFPLAILGNVLRVTSIFVIAEYGDATWARETWHDWSGLLLFYPISLALLLALHSLLEGGLPWNKARRELRRVQVQRSSATTPNLNPPA